MELFQFAVIDHPSPKERDEGREDELVVGITSILAKDYQTARLLAGRAIPESSADRLDRMEVIVRPF